MIPKGGPFAYGQGVELSGGVGRIMNPLIRNCTHLKLIFVLENQIW